MNSRQKGEDPWQYATYEGAERLQHQQTARMTFSERLEALDNMISLARGLHIRKRGALDVLRFSKYFDGDQ